MSETPVTAPDRGLDPRIARSRAKLLAAATEILVESGVRSVTVDAVADRSGVAKSTLYRHWGSRSDLLAAVMRANAPSVTVPDLTQGFESALRELVDEVRATFADPEWARILPALLSLKQQIAEIDEVAQADRDEKMMALGAVLQLGIDEGVLAADLDPRVIEMQIFGPFVLAALLGGDCDMAGLADEVVARFVAGYPVH